MQAEVQDLSTRETLAVQKTRLVQAEIERVAAEAKKANEEASKTIESYGCRFFFLTLVMVRTDASFHIFRLRQANRRLEVGNNLYLCIFVTDGILRTDWMNKMRH